jgi:hypothetical protein
MQKILSAKEVAKLDAARKRIEKYKNKIDAASRAKVGKDKFMRSGGIGTLKDSVDNFYALVKIVADNYKELKNPQEWSAKNTHKFITEKACEYLSLDQKVANQLIKACTVPDDNEKMWRLCYEGHFYGAVKGGYGNFLKKVFDDELLALVDYINDIDETAVSNFAVHFKPEDVRELGFAAHYIQDLTAPHHVGNQAIFFESLTGDNETHYAFEKYARDYLYGMSPQQMKQIIDNADTEYRKIKITLDEANAKVFAKQIYGSSVRYVQNIKGWDRNEWDKAIQNAIPIAIAATAVVFESLKP